MICRQSTFGEINKANINDPFVFFQAATDLNIYSYVNSMYNLLFELEYSVLLRSLPSALRRLHVRMHFYV